ncbi:MAG: aminodeoxychorismate/anthranilate synthase component II [Melioribacteraceae bacterium]|nr:aminodeoxychorismate/anthranilate synthase component II [Melioribacteraceae bacterium]
MKILMIDNYDSFTFNLVQLIGKFTEDIIVKRNDRITLEEIKKIAPDKIVISPGPGKPEGSNISLDVIKTLGEKTPILGVCLGHQGIGITFGGKIVSAPTLMHGKISNIVHDNKTIYKDIPQKFEGARYHSLVIDRETLPQVFQISSETEDGVIMGIRHKELPIEGIQFHPESILTKVGDKLIENWLKL